MEQQFKDVTVGQFFILNDIRYQKIQDERVSCCKVLNAENSATKEKLMILPLENVNVES
jgi:hypothetical protein